MGAVVQAFVISIVCRGRGKGEAGGGAFKPQLLTSLIAPNCCVRCCCRLATWRPRCPWCSGSQGKAGGGDSAGGAKGGWGRKGALLDSDQEKDLHDVARCGWDCRAVCGWGLDQADWQTSLFPLFLFSSQTFVSPPQLTLVLRISPSLSICLSRISFYPSLFLSSHLLSALSPPPSLLTRCILLSQ